MSLLPLLAPRSIAVIGPSDNRAWIGGVPDNLLLFMPEGKGAVAVDALVLLTGTKPAQVKEVT